MDTMFLDNKDWSDCAYAQSGLSVHEAYMSERGISYVAIRLTWSKKKKKKK